MRPYFLCIFIGLFAFTANSQSIDQLIKEADELMEKEQYIKAFDIYQKAYQKDSFNYNVVVKRGVAYLRNDLREKAFYDFGRAIKIQPDSADAFHWRGLVLYSMMLTDESIADYTRSLDLAKNDNQRIASFMNRGVSRLQKRDFQGGYEDFTRALFYKPDDIGIINNIATVLDELGRTDEAIKHLNRIVELDSTFIGSYINLGFQYIKLKRYKEAIAYFDKAIKLSPTEPLTWNNRGLARYYLNDLAGALQDINKSLSLYSQNSYAYKNRALVYLAQNKKDQACEDLRKALENGFEQMYGDEVSELIKQHCK